MNSEKTKFLFSKKIPRNPTSPVQVMFQDLLNSFMRQLLQCILGEIVQRLYEAFTVPSTHCSREPGAISLINLAA